MQREKIDWGTVDWQKVCVIFEIDDDWNFTKVIHKTAVGGKTEQELEDRYNWL